MGQMADYYMNWDIVEAGGQVDGDVEQERVMAGRVKPVKAIKGTKARFLEDVAKNKFYVGSPKALQNNWGHRTLAKAVEHAEQVLDEQDMEETFVVQIVRVVRRRKAPVEVEKV